MMYDIPWLSECNRYNTDAMSMIDIAVNLSHMVFELVFNDWVLKTLFG